MAIRNETQTYPRLSQIHSFNWSRNHIKPMSKKHKSIAKMTLLVSVTEDYSRPERAQVCRGGAVLCPPSRYHPIICDYLCLMLPDDLFSLKLQLLSTLTLQTTQTHHRCVSDVQVFPTVPPRRREERKSDSRFPKRQV